MDERRQDPRPAICVFCGARPGHDPAQRQLAREFGAGIAARGWTLVYGGGHVGMMGTVADAALAAGGRVIGVIPQRLLDREVAHRGLHRLEVVADMSERKIRFVELSDAFVSLPGGFGTLDELFEVLTLTQLHYVAKPIALTGTGGFWAGLDAFSRTLIASGFVSAEDWARVARFDGSQAAAATIDWLATALATSAASGPSAQDAAPFQPS